MGKLINSLNDPWDAVTIFENRLAEYAGSQYAVCVDSCTNALFLCLKYLEITQQVISLPKNTYAGVPMQCIHTGNKIKFEDQAWTGCYRLGNTPIIDSATRFTKGMYINHTYYCLSFHHRKTIKIGRGGAILTNNKEFVNWCRPMIYDGRHKNTRYNIDQLECIGYHMYMTPEQAELGIELMNNAAEVNPDTGSNNDYPDLSRQKIFNPYKI